MEGVYLLGQRYAAYPYQHRDAFNGGLLNQTSFGEVLYAQVKNEFDAVVDKCEVVIYTDLAECTRVRHEVAIPTLRNVMSVLTTSDESDLVYYRLYPLPGILPSHVCVVTPETCGLCGAVFMAGLNYHAKA